MTARQRTLSKAGSFSGVGIHDGKPSRVDFRPAPPKTGIRFSKYGSPIGTLGRDHAEFVLDGVARCSAIGTGEKVVRTVEHLLAAIYGLGIGNLDIDVHGDEIPAADGSAAPFVGLFRTLGLADQDEERAAYRIAEPIFLAETAKAIAIYPADRFEISYCLDYDYPYLRSQKAEFAMTEGVFEKEIAPARTFCTADEARELKSRGFGLGGGPENNVVVEPDGSHVKGLRFPDEFVRHKILDVVGDLSLLGFPVLGRIYGIRSGHALNRELVKAIRKQRENHGS